MHIVLMLAFIATSPYAYFDFVQTYENMTGDYEFSDTVVVSGDGVRLDTQSDWAIPECSRRLSFTVFEYNPSARTGVPVRLDLSSLPESLFLHADPAGLDLAIMDASGSRLPMWIEDYSSLSMKGTVWFRPNSLSPGENTFFMYYDCSQDQSQASWEDVFSYGEPMTIYTMGGTDVTVAAWLAGTTVTLPDGQTQTLDPDTVFTGTVPAGTIYCSGPCIANVNGDAHDIAIPLSFAGTSFVYPAPQEHDIFVVAAPFGSASVTFYDDAGNVLISTTVDSTPISIDQNFETSYIIESDVPILVLHLTSTGYDVFPLVPADTELWGVAGGHPVLAALSDDTHVDVYTSMGEHTRTLLNRGETLTLASSGSGGNGKAIHVISDKPVGALSYGDGDGNETVSFLPPRLMGRVYLLPFTAQYVAIATAYPSTTCSVVSPDGTELYTPISDGLASPWPNKIYITSSQTNMPPATRIVCDRPVYAYAELADTDDEHNLYPVDGAVPTVFPEEVTTSATSPQTIHPASGWVITPQYTAPLLVDSWLAARFYDPTETPGNTVLGYQLSTDGGVSWQYFDGSQWQEAVNEAFYSMPWELDAGMGSLPPARSVKLRIFLESNGILTPVQGPVALIYDEAEDQQASSLVFDEIPSPQKPGIPFRVRITAVDADGVLLNLSGSVSLDPSDGRMSPQYIIMTDGVAEEDVTVYDTTDTVVLKAHMGSASGSSNPVDFSSTAELTIEKVHGDGLYATEDATIQLVVRLMMGSSPVSGYGITFKVDKGGTLDSGTEETSYTDEGGYAYAVLKVAPGENLVHVSADGATPVSFVVRGDKNELQPAEGGCSCQSPGTRTPLPYDSSVFVLLMALALSLRGLGRSDRT